MWRRLQWALQGLAGTRPRLAGVVRLPDRMIVSSCDLPVDGAWNEARAWLAEQPDDPAALGVLLRRALEESRTEVPVEPFGSINDGPVMKLSGRRSYKAFMVDAQHVSVSWERGAITVTPSENRGRWFGHLPDRTQVLREPGDAELGAAVLAAFGDCA